MWEKIEELIGQVILIAPREVYRELKQQADDIYFWAKNNKTMFKTINGKELSEVKNILKVYPDLINYNKTTPDADPFIIALAKHRACTVITQERLKPSGKPKIPNVCKDYGINCIDLLGFFIDQKWSF